MAKVIRRSGFQRRDNPAGQRLLPSACGICGAETMKSILIVNADDFGMTEGHNNAILDAHRSGIVTSSSLLANGYAFDHAVALAKQTPTLGIGVHLTLTEGLPVASKVNTLLGPDGKFPLSNQ